MNDAWVEWDSVHWEMWTSATQSQRPTALKTPGSCFQFHDPIDILFNFFSNTFNVRILIDVCLCITRLVREMVRYKCSIIIISARTGLGHVESTALPSIEESHALQRHAGSSMFASDVPEIILSSGAQVACSVSETQQSRLTLVVIKSQCTYYCLNKATNQRFSFDMLQTELSRCIHSVL